MSLHIPAPASLTSFLPESISLTTPSGTQLLASYSGVIHEITLNDNNAPAWVDVNDTLPFLPLTVFTSPRQHVSCEWILDQLDTYHNTDDVFDDLFLQGVLIQNATTYDTTLLSCLRRALGTKVLLSETGTNQSIPYLSSRLLPSGPHLATIQGHKASLAPIYRIYHDENQAFMCGLLANGTNGTYKYSNANTHSDATIGVPIPSRLYSLNTSTGAKPLSGLRVTVKDIIDIKGIKTSNGNRAWFKLYDAVNVTAPAVQRLVDLGAVLVGKTKTAQFANADRVTADWVDYHDAFNPRGDGYQDTGVSSVGAGAATAAYDWIDVSICTDTGGSIRIPASKQGAFALRPSFGALSNEGVMLEGEYFDTLGYHTRSPFTLSSFGKTWLDESNLTTNHTRYPRKLIVPSNLWPVPNNQSQAIFAEWIDKLAGYLNATIETTCIGEYWNTTAKKPGTEFFSYMQQVALNLNWKNQIEKVIAPFQQDYAAKFEGRQPFINPFPTARFASVANVTDEDVAESYTRFVFFREWFGKHVVAPDTQSCSESLFLIPMFAGDVSYRNTVYTPPNVSSWSSFLMYYYSVQSQGPEVVFPIGQVSYISDITRVEEKLPVSIDVLAHRGCDLMLLDLAKDLADAGLLKEVKTGRTLW